MDRAFGAFKPHLYSILSAEGALYTSLGRSPQEFSDKQKKGCKPAQWASFETVSGDPSSQRVEGTRQTLIWTALIVNTVAGCDSISCA